MLSIVLATALPFLHTSQPELTTSAPWLGDVLWIRGSGLAAGQFTTVWASPAAASVPTPLGLLEIDPVGAIALGTLQPFTVPGGLGFELPVFLPAEPALAEAVLFLQGVATGGFLGEAPTLTTSVQTRLLAGRIVVAQKQQLVPQGPLEHRVSVHSSTDLQSTYTIPIDADLVLEPSVEISPDARFAAFRYGDTPSAVGYNPVDGGTVRFDFLFGGAATQDSLFTLGDWTEAPWGGAWLVYGRDPSIGPGWDIFSLPYDPTQPATPLAIGGAPGPMVPDVVTDSAWIPDQPTGLGELRMKRVSLTTGTTLDSIVVSGSGQTVIDWVELSGERMLVGSNAPTQIGPIDQGQFAWVDWQSAPSTLNLSGLGFKSRLDGPFGPMEDYVVWSWRTPTSPKVLLTGGAFRASAPDDKTVLTTLGWPLETPASLVELGGSVWHFDACCDSPPNGDGFGILHLIDFPSGSLAPPYPPFTFPYHVTAMDFYSNYVSMAAIDDFTGPQLIFGGSELAVVQQSFFEEHLLRFDPITQAKEEVSTGLWSNAWLTSITAP